jgi:hypothetical protein
MRLSVIVFGLLVTAFQAPKPAAAVIIDDFSVGPIVVERTGPTAATASQTGLDPAHVVGGSRALSVGYDGNPGQALTIDAALGELRYTVPTAHGYFSVTYGSEAAPLNLHLTADGHDRLLLEIGSGSTSLNRVALFTANGSASIGGGHFVTSVKPLPGGGSALLIPLSAYGTIELTSVNRISLEYFRLPAGELVLRRLATVPEPSATTLTAVAAASVGLQRASRRKRTQR